MEKRRRTDLDVSHASTRIKVEQMRRRHLRGVLRIEQEVNPRPWSLSLFLSELRYRESRIYVVARAGIDIVGYGGLMLVAGDGHLTNLGVAESHRRHGVATRILLVIIRRALAEGTLALTLEVRMSNTAAQALYRRFGFVPAGVRKNYYSASAKHSPASGPQGPEAPDSKEDALIMWANDIDTAAYRARLLAIERGLPHRTLLEDE